MYNRPMTRSLVIAVIEVISRGLNALIVEVKVSTDHIIN